MAKVELSAQRIYQDLVEENGFSERPDPNGSGANPLAFGAIAFFHH